MADGDRRKVEKLRGLQPVAISYLQSKHSSMEVPRALLMADLSGYTALTHAHGAFTAADLIDRYLEIVNTSLVGESVLQERSGDAVLIMSASADDLLATAVMMLQAADDEHNFLQLHGGLHYGNLLERKGAYFGTAINLTARIAAKAHSGSFWCSAAFANQIETGSLCHLQAKGKFSFKNLDEETELFELVCPDRKHYHVDPVCRMLLQDESKTVRHPSMEQMFFCSTGCLEKYMSAEQLTPSNLGTGG